ncbi:ArnT family glycosyltransferase [Amorphus coralli]|uniref:ArnT family glycosyltransferase n=1 Tax=Amorphus coralli TaxID=340680 RepID=UPI0003610206|nr:glycosyltransferase family 39 protein [Amorphus coralli]
MSTSASPVGFRGPKSLLDLASPWTVAGIVALLTVIRLVAAATVGLTEDEAYYRLWAMAPAWGYYDHPPMVAWWIAAGQAIFGDTLLGIRFFTVISVSLGSLAIWRAGAILTSDARIAGRAVVWFNATLLVGIGAMIATPDVPSAFFWGLALWAMLELVHRDDGRWWLAVGLFAGLGLLAKYSGLFLGGGIVLWMLVVPGQWRWLASPWLWLGGILALALFAPVVMWNAANDWASFAKQFGRVAGDQFDERFIPEFLLAEIGLIGPLMLPFLVVGIIGIAKSPRRMAPGNWLVLLSGLPFLAYLLVHGLHDRVQGNWPAPLYPAVALIAAQGAALVGVSARRKRGWERLRMLVAPVGIGLSLLLIVHASLGAGFVTTKDPTKQLRGWDTFSAEIDRMRETAGAQWIGAVHYTVTGELAFHLPDVPVFGVVEPLRYANLPDPDTALLQKPGLVLDEHRRLGTDILGGRFDRFEQIGTVTRTANGVAIATYDVWLVDGAKGDPTGRTGPIDAQAD